MATSDKVATVALGAHPFRPLLLAGAAGGEVLLFRFGHRQALAAYTPLLPGEGAGGDADADLVGSTPAAWHASPSGVVAAGAWGRPQAARFSRCGERLAALGAGGGLALWRLDQAPGPDPRSFDARSGTGRMARAEWASRALSRRGGALAWVREKNDFFMIFFFFSPFFLFFLTLIYFYTRFQRSGLRLLLGRHRRGGLGRPREHPAVGQEGAPELRARRCGRRRRRAAYHGAGAAAGRQGPGCRGRGREGLGGGSAHAAERTRRRGRRSGEFCCFLGGCR